MDKRLAAGNAATRFFEALCGDRWFSVFWNCLFAGTAGWVMETVFCSVFYGSLQDRGFLCLPFCPIYAIGVGAYLLLCKPPEPGFKSYVRLFFLVAVGATLFEGISGRILEQFGITLWYYDGVFPLSLRYISLPVSLFWGFAGAFYPLFVIPRVTRWALTVSQRTRRILVIAVPLLLLADFFFTCGRVAYFGRYYAIY